MKLVFAFFFFFLSSSVFSNELALHERNGMEEEEWKKIYEWIRRPDVSAKDLKEKAINLEAYSLKYQETFLGRAVKRKETSVVKKLIEAGVSMKIYYQDQASITPLSWSVTFRDRDSPVDLEFINLLVTQDTLNQQTGVYKRTPLDIATVMQDLEMIEFLLKKGADRYIKNADDQIPLDYAYENYEKEKDSEGKELWLKIIKLLEEGDPKIVLLLKTK